MPSYKEARFQPFLLSNTNTTLMLKHAPSLTQHADAQPAALAARQLAVHQQPDLLQGPLGCARLPQLLVGFTLLRLQTGPGKQRGRGDRQAAWEGGDLTSKQSKRMQRAANYFMAAEEPLRL